MHLLPEYFKLTHLQEVRQVQDVLHSVILQNVLKEFAILIFFFLLHGMELGL